MPLAEALYAQGRYEEADATLKALNEDWASDDASVNAPRLAVRAKLLAADGWTKLAEETADRALRVVRATDWLCLQVDALLAHAEVMQSAGRQAMRSQAPRRRCASRRRRATKPPRSPRGRWADRGAGPVGRRGAGGLSRDYLDLPLQDFLAEVATPEPMPGAGYCAAVTLSMAAGLVAMVAGASRERVGRGQGRRRAGEHAARARRAPGAAQRRGLRERDRAAAGRGVRARAGGEVDGSDPSQDLGMLLERAAQIPLEIAQAAVDVASLAAVVAERGDQALRADAVAAALLAQGAARAAATLVEVNLGTTESDPRVARVRDLAGSANAAAERAMATLA